MEFLEPRLESGQLMGSRLEQQESFCRRFDFIVPTVDGMDRRQECGAGGKMFFNQRAAQAGAFLWAHDCGHDDASGRRSFEHKAPPVMKTILQTLYRRIDLAR